MTTKSSYILTHSGREVSVGNTEVPSLRDIAESLSRLPRFAGHGRAPWNVLDHTLFTYDMARTGALPFAFPSLALAMLLHDAHESVTGDIPTPVKTDDMKHTQWALDLKIMDAYFPGGHDAFDYQHKQVKMLDRSALMVEALLLGPPSIVTSADVQEHFGAAPRESDMTTFLNPSFVDGGGLELGSELRRRLSVSYFLERLTLEMSRVRNATA